MEDINFGVLLESLKSFLTGGFIRYDKIIRKGKCSGYIYLPNEYAGKKCIILILNKNENNQSNIERGGQDNIPDEMLSKPSDLVQTSDTRSP